MWVSWSWKISQVIPESSELRGKRAETRTTSPGSCPQSRGWQPTPGSWWFLQHWPKTARNYDLELPDEFGHPADVWLLKILFSLGYMGAIVWFLTLHRKDLAVHIIFSVNIVGGQKDSAAYLFILTVRSEAARGRWCVFYFLVLTDMLRQMRH